MKPLEGAKPYAPNRQPGRAILKPRVPVYESVLSALPSNLDITAARAAINIVWTWRDDWSIKNASTRSVFSNRELSQDEVRRDWHHLVAEISRKLMEGGGV